MLIARSIKIEALLLLYLKCPLRAPKTWPITIAATSCMESRELRAN
jgi:hypothetical protein